jgi:hypothetical protein
VLSEAILAWLGIGIDGSWGQMIDQARDELARDPIIWWNLFGGVDGALRADPRREPRRRRGARRARSPHLAGEP